MTLRDAPLAILADRGAIHEALGDRILSGRGWLLPPCLLPPRHVEDEEDAGVLTARPARSGRGAA